MSFCSVQNSHWNTVHILFSLLRCLLCKLCKIFLQKCYLFWAFQQNCWLFLEGTRAIPQEIYDGMVDCGFYKGDGHPFNLHLYSEVASSTILGNNFPIVQWNVSNKLMLLSRGTHLAEGTHATVSNSYHLFQLIRKFNWKSWSILPKFGTRIFRPRCWALDFL